jgi:PAS domain S-box-containing protein
MDDCAATSEPMATPTRPTQPGEEMARERHLADLMPQLIWAAAGDGTIDYYNSRVTQYVGVSQKPDGTWRRGPLVHPDDLAITMAKWNHAISTGEPYTCEHRVHMVDGTYRWHLSRAEPVVDERTGEVRWWGTATDVHAQKVTEERLHAALEQLQLLQSVTATMSAQLWREADVVDALLIDGLPAAGAVDGAVVLVGPDGELHVRERRRADDTSSPGTHLDGDLLRAALRDQHITTGIDDRGATVAFVPFPVGMGVGGCVSVTYDGPVEITASHRAALRTVAELGAQALSRARAYEIEQRRADQAEALQALATALATSATVDDVAGSIALHAGRSAGADFAVVAIAVDEGRRLRLVHAPTLDDTVASAWPEVAVDDQTPLSDAFRSGRPVFVPTSGEHSLRYPYTTAAAEQAGFESTAAVPARSQDGLLIGAIGFAWERQVAMDDDLAGSLDTMVSLCAQALQRAALSEAEQQRLAFIERARAAVAGLAGAATLDDVAQLIVDRGAGALGATAAVVVDCAAGHGVDGEVDVIARSGVPDEIDRMLGGMSRDERHLALGEVAFVDDLVVIPLGSPPGRRWVVAVRLTQPGEWQRHRDRLSSVAAQWSQALDRARAHDADQALHRRTQQLQRLTTALAQVSRTADVLEVVRHQLAPAFGARAARLAIDRRGAAAEPFIAIPLDPSDPHGDLLEFDRDLPLDADERRSAEAFAVQCGWALARTRLAEREHKVTTELQHALLGDVDMVDGLAIGTLYLASEEGLDIGGDWYDVIRRDDHTAVLVIGDVVGHSLGAATAMGQLRSAVRALAHLSESPQLLLDRVAAYSENVRNARYSTLALVYLDVSTGAFDYVCAGHPLPLVVAPDGTSRFLVDGRNGPLGAFPTAMTRSGSDVVLPGGSLVLYTDGLVEQRGRPIDDGMAELAVLAADRRHLPPELLAPHLADAVFSYLAPRDDVAVLVVSPVPEPSMSMVLDASPAQLAAVRHRMRDWMGSLGSSPDEISDVLLLAGEAVANAVEHAYHGRSKGLVRVRLEHTADEYRLTVSDEGGWRWPHAPGRRGRGTAIMQAVAARLIVDRRPQGTTLHATVTLAR